MKSSTFNILFDIICPNISEKLFIVTMLRVVGLLCMLAVAGIRADEGAAARLLLSKQVRFLIKLLAYICLHMCLLQITALRGSSKFLFFLKKKY